MPKSRAGVEDEAMKRLRRLESLLELLEDDEELVDVSSDVSDALVWLVLPMLPELLVDACGRVGLGKPALADERLTLERRDVGLLAVDELVLHFANTAFTAGAQVMRYPSSCWLQLGGLPAHCRSGEKRWCDPPKSRSSSIAMS